MNFRTAIRWMIISTALATAIILLRFFLTNYISSIRYSHPENLIVLEGWEIFLRALLYIVIISGVGLVMYFYLIGFLGIKPEAREAVNKEFQQGEANFKFLLQQARELEAQYYLEYLRSIPTGNKPYIFKESQMFREVDHINGRVQQELANLSRRADLNLSIGATTTVVAGGILFYSLYAFDKEITETSKILSYYLPRISTVVFVEIFAFFFLRLYRNNLSDVKYYQNELSNIEIKVLSLRASLLIEDNDSVKKIILELIKTERNSILKRGETTVEIETSKTQGLHDKSFTDNLKVLADVAGKLTGRGK